MIPDYSSGRAEAAPTLGEAALWVPRVALYPLYFVSEFVLRRPLGFIVTKAEEHELPALLVDFFTFGPEEKTGVIPTGFVDFGFRASVGLYFFSNDFIVDDNDLRAQASWGGPDWLLFGLGDRYDFNDDSDIGVALSYTRRPDWIFHGLGPLSSDETEGRYRSTALRAELAYHNHFWRSSAFSATAAVKDVQFAPEVGCCDDVSVARRIEEGAYDAPPGLNDGYTVVQPRLELALDTRHRRKLDDPQEGSDFVSPPGGGVRLALRGNYGAGLGEERPFTDASRQRYQWFGYGATLGGFVDLSGQQRVVGLSLIADFADPVESDGEIPFTEQISLGGARPLRGFREGRLIDRSSIVTRFEYTWPVWVWLDGTFQYELGNVFGEQLEGFKLKQLRNSIGLGIKANGARDHAFELLIALGTETFDDGASVDSVRFAFGATSGF